MDSACFEPEDSSAGNRFYILVRYSVLYVLQYKQSCRWTSVFFFRKGVFSWFVLNKYITMHGAKIKKLKTQCCCGRIK